MWNGRRFATRQGATTKHEQSMRCLSLIRVVSAELFLFACQLSWEGGLMYILFGPAMAALVVIAVIQLRDHFVASPKR